MMSDRIACLGFGAISPVGATADECFSAVRDGITALREHDGLFGCREPFVASLFSDRQVMGPGFSFFDTLAIRAAAQAVESAGIDPSSPEVLFILSSIKGNVEAIGKEDVSLAVSAGRLAGHFGNPNQPLVVSNACISGLAALLQGRRSILSGTCKYAVVVGAEVQSRFIITGFQSLKAMSSSPCRPFSDDRDGLNLGEAAAAMVLGRSEEGWELADGCVRNDAHHISTPSMNGEGSCKALRYILASKGEETISFINAHGTATLYNDEMEAASIAGAGLLDIPVNGLKGCFGHTMGAAGVLESVVSILSCERRTVLPTMGFTQLGVSEPLKVSSKAQDCEGRAFIKMLSGFGGVNGALLFRKR